MWLWTQTLLMNEDSFKQQYKMHKKVHCFTLYRYKCFDCILEFVILMTKEIIPQVNFIQIYSIKVL